VAEAGTVLIAVADGVLADSLRFSLELEGFAVKLCDEFTVTRAVPADGRRRCLVADQAVFARIGERAPDLAAWSVPVVLMVGYKTDRLVDRAEAAGVAEVVETPLFGRALFDAIKSALDRADAGAAPRPA
jgi:FixJ family two-component response regulator